MGPLFASFPRKWGTSESFCGALKGGFGWALRPENAAILKTRKRCDTCAPFAPFAIAFSSSWPCWNQTEDRSARFLSENVYVQARERNTKTQTFGSGYLPVGWGVFHVRGWMSKNSVCLRSPGKPNFLAGYLGNLAGISRGLSGPVLRDTTRLSQRLTPYCALGGSWYLNTANWVRYPFPLFWAFPPWRACEVEMRYHVPPPPHKGYLSDTCATPSKITAKCLRYPPSATLSQIKGYCAVWGGVLHWAAKLVRGWLGTDTPDPTLESASPSIDVESMTNQLSGRA